MQWMAADTGSYYSSQCGPTQWPVAEVASLVRLEPDNAGALQYAVALAQAKHDDAALDEALARMASATRADDHLGDEIAEWRKVYMAHPEGNLVLPMWSEAPASERALLGALNQTSYRASPVQFALAQACTPDGDSERDGSGQRRAHARAGARVGADARDHGGDHVEVRCRRRSRSRREGRAGRLRRGAPR
ncbi:hypothetical protein [Dokdonella fugitiva]|nr:hypothetical protein [Dokdonella fugitiva]